VVALNMA